MPCLLSEGKKKMKKNHVKTYYDLSQRSERDHKFLAKIITGVETCVHGYNQESSQQTSQSNRTSSPCPKMARQVCSNVNSTLGFTDIHLTCAMWICSKRKYPKTNISTMILYGGCRKMWNQNKLKSTIQGVGRSATTLRTLALLQTVVSFLLKTKHLFSHILPTCQIYCQVTSFCYRDLPSE